MQAKAPQTAYEVYCPRCNVTFPVGARRCIHCGGSLSRDRGQLVDSPVTFDQGAGPVEDEHPRTRPFSPIVLIWVLLFVVGTIYRACSSG